MTGNDIPFWIIATHWASRSVKNKNPSRVIGRSAALVLVTHDGRGGEDYQVFQFN